MKLEYTYTEEKQTKNRVVYKNMEAPVDTLYMDKTALTQEGRRGYPDTIKVTFEF